MVQCWYLKNVMNSDDTVSQTVRSGKWEREDVVARA